LANDKNATIIALQETKFKTSHKVILNGYKVYNKPSTTGRSIHGKATLVKESTEAEEIFLDMDLDATAVKVFLGKVITICSIYIPPRKKITKEDLIKLVR
jgi:exonuclease III